MDIGLFIFGLVQAGVAFLLANGRALLPEETLRERFVRNGIFKALGTPDADAPEGFVRRLRDREGRASVVSALAMLPGLTTLGALPNPSAAFPILVSLAYAGRLLALAVLGAREASAAADGPRVSRGRVVTLADHVPAWAIGVIVALQVAFVVAAAWLVTGPGWHPWALFASLVLTAACVAGAAWLARQPQRAEDATELAWSDSVRREDVVALLTLGPTATMVLGSLLLGGDTAQGPVGILVWANFVVVMVAVLVVETASRRRATARLGAGEVSGARR